ncbi:hypothetical protein AB0I65_22485 [Nocardia fluminea]
MSRRGRPLARRTIDYYNYLLRDHINPTFQTTPVTDITLKMVRDWYSTVTRVRPRGAKSTTIDADDAVPTTRARAYEVLRMVLNVAVEDGHITNNPCQLKGATAVQPAHDAIVRSGTTRTRRDSRPVELRIKIRGALTAFEKEATTRIRFHGRSTARDGSLVPELIDSNRDPVRSSRVPRMRNQRTSEPRSLRAPRASPGNLQRKCASTTTSPTERNRWISARLDGGRRCPYTGPGRAFAQGT